jgi:hypothetical protein
VGPLDSEIPPLLPDPPIPSVPPPLPPILRRFEIVRVEFSPAIIATASTPSVACTIPSIPSISPAFAAAETTGGAFVSINARGTLLIAFEGAASTSMEQVVAGGHRLSQIGGSKGEFLLHIRRQPARIVLCASSSYPFALIAEGMEMCMPLLL